jgi:hypothetical protein
MKIENFLSAPTALHFLVGYYAFISALLLLHTIRTPFYIEITTVLKATPLASLVAAAPFALLLGIFINNARKILNQFLLHRPTYQLDVIPEKLKKKLIFLISRELDVACKTIDLKQDLQFKLTKIIILPEFEEYSIHKRWLHDFLECSFYISIFSLIVLLFRALAGPYNGLEWSLLIGYFSISLVAIASFSKLRVDYTLAEAATILAKKQYETAENANGNRG